MDWLTGYVNVHLIRTQHTFPSFPHSLSLAFIFFPLFLISLTLSTSILPSAYPHSLLSLTIPPPLYHSLSLTSLSPTSTQIIRVSLQRTASSLACRGLMHSYDPVHTSVVGGNKWRPLHKPQWIGVNHKVHAQYTLYCTSWMYVHVALLFIQLTCAN